MAVRLHDLEVQACVGVPDFERRRPQTLLVCAAVSVDPERIASALRSDDIAGTLDYAALAEVLRGRTAELCCRLIERLAWELANSVFEHFAVAQEVRIAVKKPNIIPGCRYAEVEVVRSRMSDGGEGARE